MKQEFFIFFTKEEADGKSIGVAEVIEAHDPFFLKSKITKRMQECGYISFSFTKRNNMKDIDMLNFATHHCDELEMYLNLKDAYDDIF